VALAVAARVPDLVRKLVLYEAPWPHLCDGPARAPLEALASAGNWDGFAAAFFGDLLAMPRSELDALRASEDWPSIVADAPTSLQDMLAVARHRFDAEPFRAMAMPVLLQVGSESPADLYLTSALAAVLPAASVEALAGQAHDAMITAPASIPMPFVASCCRSNDAALHSHGSFRCAASLLRRPVILTRTGIQMPPDLAPGAARRRSFHKGGTRSRAAHSCRSRYERPLRRREGRLGRHDPRLLGARVRRAQAKAGGPCATGRRMGSGDRGGARGTLCSRPTAAVGVVGGAISGRTASRGSGSGTFFVVRRATAVAASPRTATS
jgi:hypothetical protein